MMHPLPYHSPYCAFHTAFQPSGTLGGGGPAGGASAMMLKELSNESCEI